MQQEGITDTRSAGMLLPSEQHRTLRFAKPKFDKHQRHPSPLDALPS